MNFIAAITLAIQKLLSSTTSGALEILNGLLKLPAQLLFGGSSRIPSSPPLFEPGIDAQELVAALNNGHASAPATTQATDPVSLVVRFAKTPKAKRITVDLSQLDVMTRARLWMISESGLVELSRASRSNIEKFLKADTTALATETRTGDPERSLPANLQMRIRATIGRGTPYGSFLTP
jgi:hypothetical protein